MIETKFTAGPWLFTDGYDLEIIMDGSIEMSNARNYPWCPSNKADWHLIAAAPEMYEELAVIHRIISDNYGDCTGLHIALGEKFIKSSGDVLAKARGESNV